MKKEIIICIVVIILVIALNSITDDYTKNSAESVKADLSIVKEEIEQHRGDDKISESVKKAKYNWDNRYKTLAYYLEHDELEKVTVYLVGLESKVKSEEYPQAIEELEKCIYILDHIEDKYSFNLRNIF